MSLGVFRSTLGGAIAAQEVLAHMFVQMCFLGEGAGAHGALERPLPRVGALVT